MSARTARLLGSVLLLAGCGASLAAQTPVQVGGMVSRTAARVSGVSTDLATGTVLGGQGSATLGPLLLSIGYREGRLHDGTTQPLLVEGGIAADFQLLPWLRAGLGPEARAYKLDSATVRRVWVAGRLGVAVPIVANSVRTDVRVWRSVVTTSAGAGLNRVAGGEVGISYRAAARWWIRLATTFDDASFDGPRHERLSGLTLAAEFGR